MARAFWFEAVELLVDYFRVIAGEHPDWADYRRAMVDQGKCLIRVTPARWALASMLVSGAGS